VFVQHFGDGRVDSPAHTFACVRHFDAELFGNPKLLERELVAPKAGLLDTPLDERTTRRILVDDDESLRPSCPSLLNRWLRGTMR
jgi:hypothetical protein